MAAIEIRCGDALEELKNLGTVALRLLFLTLPTIWARIMEMAAINLTLMNT